MLQHITVTTHSSTAIKPLLQAAIRTELKTLTHSINRTQERVAAFERQFGFDSVELLRRLQFDEVEETLDVVEWQGELKTLQILEEQRQALQHAELS